MLFPTAWPTRTHTIFSRLAVTDAFDNALYERQKCTVKTSTSQPQPQTKYIRAIIEFLRIRTLTASSGFIGHTHALMAYTQRSEASL